MKCRKCRSEIPDESAFCLKCGAKQAIDRKPKARGNGTGSVYKLPNGSWIAVKSLKSTVDEYGKMHRKTVSKSGFKTKRDAINYLPYLQEKPKRRKDVTFKELYDLWKPWYKKAGASTMGCYQAAMNYFKPVWYELFSEIDIDDLQECLDECPCGKRTLENMKTLCGLLYKYAIPRHYASLNLGAYLVIDAEAGAGKIGLPSEALEALKTAVGKVQYADYLVAQCYLGFRPSEFLALKCADYDKKNKLFIGGAKTEAGTDRTVTISPKIQNIVDSRMKGRVAGAIFGKNDGTPMTIENYRKEFYKVLDACGIENPVIEKNGVKRRTYTPHSCRHTFATLLKNVQAPDKDKLKLIGHTSPEMLRHYQDVDVEGLRRITDAI